MSDFALMARFNGWVNARLYGAVARLGDDAYRAERGLFFGSIHRTLNHLLLVDRLWRARLGEAEHGFRSLDAVLYDDFAALRRAREEEDERLVALVAGLTEAALARTVTYPRIIGTGTHTTRRDHILLGLFNHQAHHRGQVHAALTQAGIEPPPLDLIDYLEAHGLS